MTWSFVSASTPLAGLTMTTIAAGSFAPAVSGIPAIRRRMRSRRFMRRSEHEVDGDGRDRHVCVSGRADAAIEDECRVAELGAVQLEFQVDMTRDVITDANGGGALRRAYR